MRIYVFIMSAICALAALAGFSYAQEPDCLICHPEKAEGRSVHSAVKKGCKVCHIGVNASDIPHRFLGASLGLPAEGEKLCFGCHDRKKFTAERVVHMPVSGGMCTGCHDPHSSSSAGLLVSQGLCFSCHDRAALASKPFVHAPVSGGMCTSCHRPHQSTNAALLRVSPPELCFGCHDKAVFTGPSVHLPVLLGMCVYCHEPHQSDVAALAKGRSSLCLECHDRADLQKTSVHAGAGECLVCHRPHASSNNSLLR